MVCGGFCSVSAVHVPKNSRINMQCRREIGDICTCRRHVGNMLRLLGSRIMLPKLLFDLLPFITVATWWLRNLPFTAKSDKATDEKSNNGDTTRIVTLKIGCVALGFIIKTVS